MAAPVITTLGLCAGVGMLDLGLHIGLEYLGFRPVSVGYCERDSYAASRILERMEEQALEPAPVWAGNLEAVRWERWTGVVDCIVAGFPCQPHSMAGKREGTDDARWIWPAIADCIRVVRPRLVYLENVSGLRSSGGMAPVLADLAALGFSVEYDSVRASDVGASHQRERVFILAVSTEHGRSQGRAESGREQGRSDAAERDGAVGNAGCMQRVPGYVEGRSGGAEKAEHEAHDRAAYRSRQLADPGCAGDERRGRPREVQSTGCPPERETRERQRSGHDAGHGNQFLADASQPRREGREQPGTHVADGRTDGRTDSPYRPASELRDVPLFAPGPNDERWTDIIREHPYLAPATEPGVCFMADGLAVVVGESRPDQLRTIGNGVVPTQAALALVTLARRAGIA